MISRGLVIRAALFSVLINSAFIYEFIAWDGLSPFSFTDIDEVTYLPQALEVASGNGYDWFYYEHDSPKPLLENLFRQPNAVIDFVFGSLGRFLGLSGTALGLSLDLVFPFFSYLLAVVFFRLLSCGSPEAEVSAVVMLACPWLFATDNYFASQVLNSPSLVNTTVTRQACVPVLRSIYTQASYPVFLLSLICVFRLPKAEKKLPIAIASGSLVASLIYIYFFAWGSALAISGLCLLFFVIREACQNSFKAAVSEFLKPIVLFFTAFLVVSFPGIFMSFPCEKLIGTRPC